MRVHNVCVWIGLLDWIGWRFHGTTVQEMNERTILNSSQRNEGDDGG